MSLAFHCVTGVTVLFLSVTLNKCYLFLAFSLFYCNSDHVLKKIEK